MGGLVSPAVTVLGMSGGPPGAEASAALSRATLVVGARRHLDAVAVPVGADTVVLGALAPALDRLAEHDGPAVVLASGDPGFFGIVRALRERGLRCDVRPAVSSVATAFARIGLPWDDALVVSAHGRALAPAVDACRAHPKVAVLTAPDAGADRLGEALRGLPRTLVVAQRLGTPGERVTTCTPSEAAATRWPDPHVVLVLAEPGPVAEPGPAGPPPAGGRVSPRGWAWPRAVSPSGWALPEDAFEHRDAMVTKVEVRALALARLGPCLGRLVWDVGAGCGSVAVECARFGAAVVGVERDAAQCARIAANAARHAVEVEVVEGTAPAALAGLPDPDAVFVGGGGPAVVAAAAERGPARIVVALAALERVGACAEALRAAGYAVSGTQLSAARLAGLPDGTHRLSATNPVTLVWGDQP